MYKINLYISSYLPLYFLLIYKGWYEFIKDKNHKISLNILIVYMAMLAILIIVGLATIIYFLCKKTNRVVSVRGSFSSKEYSVTSYIMTYLSPVLSIELSNGSSLVINLALFCFIGILYVKNNLVYVNPVLLIFGFYTYEWESKDCKRVIIANMSLGELHSLVKEVEFVDARKFENDVWLYKKMKSKK